MSEYIITCDEETASWIGNDVDSMRPIVRCRDCKQFDDRFHYPLCRRDMSCDEIAVYAEPDGYCAWGERKEGGE